MSTSARVLNELRAFAEDAIHLGLLDVAQDLRDAARQFEGGEGTMPNTRRTHHTQPDRALSYEDWLGTLKPAVRSMIEAAMPRRGPLDRAPRTAREPEPAPLAFTERMEQVADQLQSDHLTRTGSRLPRDVALQRACESDPAGYQAHTNAVRLPWNMRPGNRPH